MKNDVDFSSDNKMIKREFCSTKMYYRNIYNKIGSKINIYPSFSEKWCWKYLTAHQMLRDRIYFEFSANSIRVTRQVSTAIYVTTCLRAV